MNNATTTSFDLTTLSDHLSNTTTSTTETVMRTMLQEEDPRNISSLTDSQEKILVVLYWCSALLSITGSSLILYDLRYRSNQKTKQQQRGGKPQNMYTNKASFRRILAAMACWDIIFSAQLCLSPLLVPAETSQQVWAIGNQTSCNFLGFMTSVGFASVYYNGTLSLYYALTITKRMTDAQFSKRVEPWCHAINNVYPLITGIVGLAMGFYSEHETGPGCWVDDWPRGCGEGPGQEPCQSHIIAWMFAGLPTLMMLCMIVVNNILILRHVNRTLRVEENKATGEAASADTMSVRSHGTLATAKGSVASNVRDSMAQNNKTLVRAVGNQSLLYVAAFIFTLGWGIILRVIEGQALFWPEDDHRIFPFYVITSICLPLQGALNYLIYMRPRWILKRSKKLSSLQAQEEELQIQKDEQRRDAAAHSTSPYLEEPETARADARKSKSDRSLGAASSITTRFEDEPTSHRRNSTGAVYKLEATSWLNLTMFSSRHDQDDPSTIEQVDPHPNSTLPSPTTKAHGGRPTLKQNNSVKLDKTSWALASHSTNVLDDNNASTIHDHHPGESSQKSSFLGRVWDRFQSMEKEQDNRDQEDAPRNSKPKRRISAIGEEVDEDATSLPAEDDTDTTQDLTSNSFEPNAIRSNTEARAFVKAQCGRQQDEQDRDLSLSFLEDNLAQDPCLMEEAKKRRAQRLLEAREKVRVQRQDSFSDH